MLKVLPFLKGVALSRMQCTEEAQRLSSRKKQGFQSFSDVRLSPEGGGLLGRSHTDEA